jgi:hypothetical protein
MNQHEESTGHDQAPLALAQDRLKIAQKELPTCASPYSKKEFNPPQLFVLLVLRQFFQTELSRHGAHQRIL